jgi:hypothetical protein
MNDRVLMLGLDEALSQQASLPAHIREALAAISRLQTSRGEPLSMCLLSDYPLRDSGRSSKGVAESFQEYVRRLDELGLKDLFEPTSKRVTLSGHAGVSQPQVGIFRAAISRLEVKATLTECLYLSSNESFLKAAADLGMDTLQFGVGGFSVWEEAPLRVAVRVSGFNARNLTVGKLDRWNSRVALDD